MAGVKIKGAQVKSSLTKAPQNATIVHCAEDVEEGDILCVTGMHGAFMSVVRADHTASPPHLGPFYVADFAAKTGFIGRIAVDEKIVTHIAGSGSVGGGVSLHTAGGISPVGTGAFAAASGGTAIRGGPSLGRILVVGDSDTGKILLKPASLENVFTGVVVISSGTTATVTFAATASYNNCHVQATMRSNPDNLNILSAEIQSGVLTIRLSGAVGGLRTIYYAVYF